MELFFDEKDVTLLPPDKRDLGMVFQNYAFFHTFTLLKYFTRLENSSLSNRKTKYYYRSRKVLG